MVGQDPRVVALLSQRMRQGGSTGGGLPGGVANQAIAALENALIDIKAKAAGMSVSELLGGPLHKMLPMYWTQCGNSRLDRGWTVAPDQPNSGKTPVRSYADIEALGKEAVQQEGFKSIKSMIHIFDDGPSHLLPPSGSGPGNVTQELIDNIVNTQKAWRRGAGPNTLLKLDLNFNFRPEGYIRICKALEPVNMDWIELDIHDPAALRQIRDAAPMPIASLGPPSG